MWKNADKIVKNVQKPGTNRQNIVKSSKMSKNAEKIVINVQTPRKKRQIYRKIVKNIKKH